MGDALLSVARSLVIFVDHQERLLPAIHNGAGVLAEAERLAKAARLLKIPMVGTEQNPDKLGSLPSEVRSYCDLVLQKMHFDACADGLIEATRSLMSHPRSQIIISGCETHVCVLQTAFGMMDAGYKVYIVSSASGSRSTEDRDLALSRLSAAGATILSLEMVFFEWVRTCDHPQFRSVLKLIKERKR